VKLAPRSRKGYWRMGSNSIVLAALINAYLPQVRGGGGHRGYESRLTEPPGAGSHAGWGETCGRLT